MDKEIKLRIDEMVAAIEAAPHLDIALYAVNVCRQNLCNNFGIDEEFVSELIEEYNIDEAKITAYFERAQSALTTYQLSFDDDEFTEKYDKLEEQIDFNDPIMALAQCLIIAAIDDRYRNTR